MSDPLARATAILDQYAEQMRDGCSGDGENFCCEDCPVGRETCRREHAEVVAAAEAVRAAIPSENAARVAELEQLINTPELEDFLQGVRVEAAHQVERWGDAHDRSKSAENWYWLVGYLAGKALRSAIAGDRDKALHHTISSAAVLFQWHKAIAQDTSGNGLGNDQDLKPDEVKR